MAPNSREGGDAQSSLGKRSPEMTLNREIERPVWSSQGTLIRKPPVRHYIPKHPFYYSAKELSESRHKTRQDFESHTKKYVSQVQTQCGDARRAFSAPGGQRSFTNLSEKLPPLSSKGSRPGTQSRRRHLGPGSVNWIGTPVPGVRTLPEYDLYRKDALDEKPPLYQLDSGLLPKYMGYVPGLKFRYGSTFGQLTYNAKEIGVEKSATWGGSVSLF